MRVRVDDVREAGTQHREDRVVTEEPLEIRLAGPGSHSRQVVVTMRTPGHDFELAAGWLFHEGVISGLDDVATVAYCTDADLTEEEKFNVVTVNARHLRRSPAARGMATSACGVCGSAAISDVFDHLTHAGAPSVGSPLEGPWVRAIPTRMRERQSLFERTGGLHAAALFADNGDLRWLREDVGRHNAVDKVTGAQLLEGVEVLGGVIGTSGRLGFEIVQKAVAARRTAVVGVGAPTSLAVELARKAGLGLAGFASTDRFVVYAGNDRFAL